ncbi:hypothetical protein [Phenylobacterium sp. J367]|uniref:hypothetical protein n=1 Tax=Phenylobacterium sp. J367 TaxID=2898435 RepID=UPI002151600F|nr:hypothetical protein [Phenylobacterium sp. J367]MCR5876961.1 hypothetical protein [Phenylobacterium sp. J367]MCR5877029.1 hypothetical protein [Phenylobacterium sp. J367]
MAHAHTPAELACIRAFRVLVEDQGVEAASPKKPFVLKSALDDLPAAFAEINAAFGKHPRSATYTGPLDGLADSMGAALAHRLRNEDR